MGSFIYKGNDLISGINYDSINLIEKKASIIELDDVGYPYIKPTNIQKTPDSIEHLELSDNYIGLVDSEASPMVTIQNDGIQVYGNRNISINAYNVITEKEFEPVSNVTSKFSVLNDSLTLIGTNYLTLLPANFINIGASSRSSTSFFTIDNSKINMSASQNINISSYNMNAIVHTSMNINTGAANFGCNRGNFNLNQTNGCVSVSSSNNIATKASVGVNNSYNDLYATFVMSGDGSIDLKSHWLVSFNNSSTSHPMGSNTEINMTNGSVSISASHGYYGGQSINIGEGSIKFTCNGATMTFNSSGLYINNNKVNV